MGKAAPTHVRQVAKEARNHPTDHPQGHVPHFYASLYGQRLRQADLVDGLVSLAAAFGADRQDDRSRPGRQYACRGRYLRFARAAHSLELDAEHEVEWIATKGADSEAPGPPRPTVVGVTHRAVKASAHRLRNRPVDIARPSGRHAHDHLPPSRLDECLAP
jgi:hypothetical protein